MICVVELQIISKVINTGNYSIIEDNLLTEEYFVGYEAEFNFIVNHYKEYNNVPDKVTFLSKFPDIELVDVSESDEYLIDTIREQYLFSKSVPIVQKIAQILKEDANSAAEYMLKAVKELTPDYRLGGVDIISKAVDRYNSYVDRIEHQDEWYFTTGFPELDDMIHGIQRGEELIVIFARTNQGKSWVLEKMISNIWQLGFNVGYISPEMSADSIGYRFDTLYKGYSNKDLVWGKTDIDLKQYESYIQGLKSHSNKFIVSTPLDFDRKITVSKLRNFVKQYKLDALAIDGITYITDERGKRGDNKTTSLTNISEDLMMLSIELNIPILVVVQANRSGVVDADTDGTPELESIRDSDGISHNASKVISIRQKDGALEMGIKKQRFGVVGEKLKYVWNINTGEFIYTPDYDSPRPERERKQERKQKSGKDVF